MTVIDEAELSVDIAKITRFQVKPRLLVGGIGLIVAVLTAVIGPYFTPFNPITQHLTSRLQGPSTTYFFGTDSLGRDIFSRLIFGLRPSMTVGVAAILLAAIGGTFFGVLAGYFGRWLDAIVGRIVDLLWSWPAIFLALAIVLLLGPGPTQDIFAIGIAELPIFVRVARAVTLANVRSPHVEAARSLGASSWRIMWRHILPFAVPPLIVQFAISAPSAVLTEAALNYLGLGIQPPSASLGSMISEASEYLGSAPSGAIFPILAIAWIVLSLTLMADGLQDMLDPRRRGWSP